MLRLTAVGFLAGVALAASQSPDSVTFNKDVLPILQKNCQGCHRPGEVAPMSLVNYTEARPWAKAIKVAVLARKMPPWFADPQYGHFANDRRLSEAEINTLVAWADNGALEGNPHDAPAYHLTAQNATGCWFGARGASEQAGPCVRCASPRAREVGHDKPHCAVDG
jgi:hypothetical protein